VALSVHKWVGLCLGACVQKGWGLFWRRVCGWGGLFGRRRFFGGRWVYGGRRRLGELVMNVSKEDQDRITKAIRAAEAKTSGEIVCVLAETSVQSTASPVFIAAVISLALPWLLTAFTAMTVFRILSLQVVVFL